MALPAHPVRQEPTAAAPAAEVLTHLGQELDALAGLSDELQRVLGGVLNGALHAPVDRGLGGGQGHSLDPDGVRALQSADLISQRLRSLAAFTVALAKGCDPQWRMDRTTAASALVLEDLKIRLQGRLEPPRAAAGDLDLFG
jgi:hypothetical protein